MPRRLRAANHGEAYALWAQHFEDPALMANRDAKTTRLKLARVADRLPIAPGTDALDVGPGDGELLRLLAARGAAACGVDPNPAATARLAALLRDAPDVRLAEGSALDLPFPDASFDVVVVNSVLHMLDTPAEVRCGLAEALRVCRPGGTVWIGELPFRPELARGIPGHMLRKLREYGARAYLRLLLAVYVRPLLRGEPLVLHPARNTSVPRETFEAWAEALGGSVECFRHEELRRPSTTRNDYRITRRSAPGPGRAAD